jgi:hypothetical protein
MADFIKVCEIIGQIPAGRLGSGAKPQHVTLTLMNPKLTPLTLEPLFLTIGRAGSGRSPGCGSYPLIHPTKPYFFDYRDAPGLGQYITLNPLIIYNQEILYQLLQRYLCTLKKITSDL